MSLRRLILLITLFCIPILINADGIDDLWGQFDAIVASMETKISNLQLVNSQDAETIKSLAADNLKAKELNQQINEDLNKQNEALQKAKYQLNLRNKIILAAAIFGIAALLAKIVMFVLYLKGIPVWRPIDILF